MGYTERARARYAGGRPDAETREIQRRFMRRIERGLAPFAVVLETRGRTTGRPRRVPLAIVRRRGIRYLVSMLGQDVGWVRNVRAAGGRAALIRRHREEVVLSEVPVAERPPILRRYLLVAFGARPHMAVRWSSPRQEFERVAGDYPVFRVDPATGPGISPPPPARS
ncbi:nitroreductase/quinone reductase family protein [Agromyces aurantiacus]|uniref:Nitroreductase/quinone reductase family protein n=1 Tax=Agromyces aurantiacus TaxID=165814 RepID=A0ABV9R290_9MICO|nr:nitroreductase/quinone reductase family protein [Agromyces aurantiacus]MBM7505874.1 deazaflavin-dependent oxidoreductase (nitroreductase family) [Agromyces aurantiacus]